MTRRAGIVDKVKAALDARDGSATTDFSAYRGRPAPFVEEKLGVRLWSHQHRLLEALEQHRRVAWRTAHGVGKSTVAVVAAAYWLLAHGALVIMSAPSYRQVLLVLWRGLQRVHRQAREPLGGEFLDTPERGWRFPDGRGVFGFSAGDPERFAGLHAPRVLVIIDEASGIDAPLFDAIKGALTGESRLLLIGNPTRQVGEFFDAFNRKASLYCQLHTSALDVPNVSGAEPEIPGLVDSTWLAEAAADFGEESAAYAVRALGEFPRQSADSVISIGEVDAAKERWHELARTAGAALGPLEVGVDVARFGDDETVIVCRRGPFMYEPVALRGADVAAVAARVAAVVIDRATTGERATVRVDVVGVGGGVADLLRRDHGAAMDVVDVNAGAAAVSERYQRTRDELHFCMRDWLRAGGALPPDPKLEGELLAPTYTFSPAQRIVVESKDETKKKIKRSPDRADAAALAVYTATGEPTTAELFARVQAPESLASALLDWRRLDPFDV